MKKSSIILLAGGTGSRISSGVPKQFLDIKEKKVVRYSFDILRNMSDIAEIIVVCAPPYRDTFDVSNIKTPIKFALPGERRQDSLSNGFQMVDKNAKLVVIHDAARPMLTLEMMRRVMEAGHEHGAAAVAVPVKFTVKESDGTNFVKHTHDRSKLWEVQTPQALKPDLIRSGLKKAAEEKLTVTDDVTLAEILGHKVKLVQGCYTNIKITTVEDLAVVERLMV